MNAGDALLVYLDPHREVEGWLLLSRGEVAARGAGLEGLPPLADPDTGDPVRVVAVVPGEAVSVHWLDVPADLSPPQAVAAARLIASEVSAQPLADIHVAVGPEDSGGLRAVALAPALAMAGWLGRLQAHGLDPDAIVPEPLLLPPPEQGFVRHDRGETPLFRGPSDAFSVEPELAGIVTSGAPVEEIDAAHYEAGLADALARLPVDLRQGPFAKRRRWQVEWKLVRRLALLAAALLMVTLAVQFAAILRYTYAADALEAEADATARRALRGRAGADVSAGLQARLAELGGAGAGYSALASAVFAAVRATPNIELAALAFDRGGVLRATVQGDTPAAFVSLRERIEASGLAAEIGPVRSGGGRPTADMVVDMGDVR
ncbi:MAG TPA: type II secretion system protein GspL [Allosphingosinicella sp.]|nr:type II secretion system protein GspL [Allosphingosinicella sp.]